MIKIEHDTSIEINSIEELKMVYDCLIKQGYKPVQDGETLETIANDYLWGISDNGKAWFITYDVNDFMLSSHRGVATIHHITADNLK